jgi:hypothetical protein
MLLLVVLLVLLQEVLGLVHLLLQKVRLQVLLQGVLGLVHLHGEGDMLLLVH